MDKEKKVLKISNRRKGIAGCILFAAGFALLFISRISRGFAIWYSAHVYLLFVNTLGRLMEIFPFSVSELMLYILTVTLIITLLYLMIQTARKAAGKQEWVSWALNVYLAVAVLLFLFGVNCGVNYHKESFSESSGIIAEKYSAQELSEVCQWLAEKVNERCAQVERDSDGVMRLSSAKKTNAEAVMAMKKLGQQYPELSGYFPKPKNLMFSWILSVQDLTGIYSPFTVEANYNNAMLDYNIPFTACHELSHLRGFMQEEEANFIAFLASSGSEDIGFQYSGYLMGWRYCMNVLYQADYEAWEEIRSRIDERVEADLEANREFWQKYDGKIAEVSNKVNDTYLKANDQSDGVQSYNRMVDLIVAYKKQE